MVLLSNDFFQIMPDMGEANRFITVSILGCPRLGREEIDEIYPPLAF